MFGPTDNRTSSSCNRGPQEPHSKEGGKPFNLISK